jgi:tetratricopeptide (TPR) repeat protein
MAGGRIKRFVLAGWLIVTPPAATAQDSQTCADSSGDAGIAICTREIRSGKYTGAHLARRYYNRGVSYSAKDDNDRAIADYSEAIRLDPTLYPLRINRGLIYFDNNDYGRAITDFSEAIRLNPKQALGFFNRGYVYAVQGNTDRAMPDLSEADPARSQLYQELSVARLREFFSRQLRCGGIRPRPRLAGERRCLCGFVVFPGELAQRKAKRDGA